MAIKRKLESITKWYIRSGDDIIIKVAGKETLVLIPMFCNSAAAHILSDMQPQSNNISYLFKISLNWCGNDKQTRGPGLSSIHWLNSESTLKFKLISICEKVNEKLLRFFNYLVNYNFYYESASSYDSCCCCCCSQHKEMSYMCTFKLLLAKRLPFGVCENKNRTARHSFCTAGHSDVIRSTMDCLPTGHVINVFWFSSESRGGQTICSKNDWTVSLPCL